MDSDKRAFQLVFKQYGESAILVEWPKKIDKNILTDIREFVQKIEHLKIKAIIDINFVYSSLLIVYNTNLINYQELKNELINLYFKAYFIKKTTKQIWYIPVCYDEKFGIDLQLVASEKKYSINNIIKLHSSVNYTVFGIGFLPGFLYLGGLPNELEFPRKSNPRANVEKGSVAIAGNQTGIYPQNSPGGWNIIGKTPISIFNINKANSIEIMPGDELKFYSITLKEFDEIEEHLKNGFYNLKNKF